MKREANYPKSLESMQDVHHVIFFLPFSDQMLQIPASGLCSEKHLTFTEHQQYEPQYRKFLNPEYYFVFSVFLPSLWKRCTRCCH